MRRASSCLPSTPPPRIPASLLFPAECAPAFPRALYPFPAPFLARDSTRGTRPARTRASRTATCTRRGHPRRWTPRRGATTVVPWLHRFMSAVVVRMLIKREPNCTCRSAAAVSHHPSPPCRDAMCALTYRGGCLIIPGPRSSTTTRLRRRNRCRVVAVVVSLRSQRLTLPVSAVSWLPAVRSARWSKHVLARDGC